MDQHFDVVLMSCVAKGVRVNYLGRGGVGELTFSRSMCVPPLVASGRLPSEC